MIKAFIYQNKNVKIPCIANSKSNLPFSLWQMPARLTSFTLKTTILFTLKKSKQIDGLVQNFIFWFVTGFIIFQQKCY